MIADPDGMAIASTLREHMDALESLVSPLSDDACSQRPADGWSIKETLSHLQGEDGATFLDGIHRIIREDEPAIDVEPGITNFNADRQGAQVDQLVAAVLAQYRGIADVFASAGADVLARRAHISLLAQTPFGEHPTLAEWGRAIAGMHVAGHVADLQTQIERMSR